MKKIKLSESTAVRRQIYFVAKDINSPSQPKTGLAATWAAADIQVSKNGAAAANSAGTVTEVDATNFPGLYYYQATATEVNTLGSILLNFKNASMVAQTQEVAVVAFDPYDAVRMGLTALPNANANAAGGLLTAGTGTNQINTTTGGVDVRKWLGTAPNALSAAGNVKTDIEEWRAAVPANLDGGGMVGADVNAWLGVAPNALITGRVDSSLGEIQAVTEVKATLGVVDYNTAQAGASTTITLAAGSSAVTDFYKGLLIHVYGGTGAGQARYITAYNGSTKVATVDAAWATNPDATSTYGLWAERGSGYSTDANVVTWKGTAPNALVSGRVDSNTGAMAANVITSTAINTGAITGTKFSDDVNVDVAHTATAQAGSTSTTIKLDAGASAADNFYNELICYIAHGTGAGQSRQVTGYVGSTKVATVDAAWATTPDATSVFQLLPTAAGGVSGTVNANVVQWQGSAPSALDGSGYVQTDVQAWKGTFVAAPTVGGVPKTEVASVDAGTIARASFAQDALDLLGDIRRNTAQAGTSTTITLDAAASTVDNRYKNGLILIVGGTGAGQFRSISNYVGATKVATVNTAWDTNPDNTSVFQILAAGSSVDSASIATAVWDEARSGHTTAGTFGEGINVVTIATAAANTVRDALLNFSHRSGRTVKGFIRRLDALASGKATGLVGAVATFFQPDGTTTEYSADQDTTAGTRATADVTNSET